MKLVLQRVTSAAVSVESETVGSIGAGLLLLVGFGHGDDEECLQPMVDKVVNLRIFADDAGKFAKSLIDIRGSILVVSQFTLYADTAKGRRPGFSDALEPQQAELLYEKLLARFRSIPELTVACGKFGAHMKVSLENDGPVTILL